MQYHLYHGLLAALGASVAVAACDRAAAAPTVQNAQSAQPGSGFTVTADNAGSGHTITYVSNGSFALTDQCTFSPDGLSRACTYLRATQNGTPNASSTFLIYVHFSCTWDPINAEDDCPENEFGAGIIPNSDFVVRPGLAQLHTDTQADPDFVVYAGPVGSIDVTYRKANSFSSSTQSISDTDYGPFSVMLNLHSSTTGAVASGSLFGTSLDEHAYAEMGTEHGSSSYHVGH